MPATTVTCACGAVYERSEHHFSMRDEGHQDCLVCRRRLEAWNSTAIPTYRLIAAPERRIAAGRWLRDPRAAVAVVLIMLVIGAALIGLGPWGDDVLSLID